MSKYCVAQKPIPEPIRCITEKPFFSAQSSRASLLFSAPVPPEWGDFLHSCPPLEPPSPDPNTPYSWTQDIHTKRVTVTFPAPLIISEITSISIVANHIEGTFYGEVSNPVIADHSIQFEASDFWPILIADGNPPDRYSAHFLALFSIVNSNEKFYRFWAVKSAHQGFSLEQQTLGMYLLQAGEVEEAVYWMSLAALAGHQFCALVAAQYLFETTDENRDLFLAENILVELVKRGNKDALYYLGLLHTRVEGKEFQGDRRLGIQYLKKSVEEAHDDAAERLLEELESPNVGAVAIGVAVGIVMIGTALAIVRHILKR
jgi:hypothetical protein